MLRVSILARGPGLAATSLSGDGGRALLTDRDITDRLTIAMAGSAAEAGLLGRTSTIGEDDISQARCRP